MGAEIDSLEIKIESSAKTIGTTLDKIVSKVDTLAASLNKINVSRISSEFEKLFKSMSGINGNIFKGFADSAKTAETSVNKLTKEASKGIKAKATFDISDYQKATAELGKRFADAGKNIQFSGNLSQLEKQYESLSKHLDNLAEKENKIVYVGKKSPFGEAFHNLQYDISSTLNQLETLSKKINELSAKNNAGEIRIFRSDSINKDLEYFKNEINRFTAEMQKITQNMSDSSILNIPIKNLEQDISELKSLFPQEKSLIDAFIKEAERLKGMRSSTPSAKATIPDSARVSMKDTMKSANKAVFGAGQTKTSNIDGIKKKMDDAGNEVTSFGKKMNDAFLSASPNISSLRGKLSSLASGMKKLGSATLSAIPGMKSLGKAIKNSRQRVTSLAKRFVSLYAIMRAGKAAWGSVISAQDYIEDFNYFSVALDKIGKDSKSQFRKAGYDSAGEYADSFKGRFAKLQKQMTGYDVDIKTGNLDFNISHNLGLDISEVMQYQAQIAQITNSTGQLGEVSIDAAKGLSMLAADWSSLSNTRLVDVQNNFTSALNGQARAVYKYGIDLTQAGLQQIAYNHGISESVKNMSNASKQQLRLLGLIEGSKVAWGDLARTINQPANQLRMLQAGFQNLARSIGNLFMPILQKVYPYLNAMVMVLQEFVQWITKLTGVKMPDTGSYSVPDMEEPADGMDDYADATDKAAKKQKKFNDNLQGFDIINKLQKDESDSDSDKDKNKNINLSGDIASALANYQKAWDDAFRSANNKAVQLAKKIKKALIEGWEKGDFTELGKKLANWITKGLNSIPWNKIKKNVKKIAKSIATFLNGFLTDKTMWKAIGTTFAEGLNAVIDAGYVFWTTFNWLKFGKALGEGIDTFIKEFDAEKFGKLIGAKLRGIIQFAYGMVETFVKNDTFSNLGNKIGDAINGFLEDMGKVDERTGLTGWEELGKTLSDSITGILDTINTALEAVRWTDVGKAIGEFLGEIKWEKILVKLGKTIANAIFAALKVAISAFVTDPIGVTKTLVTVLGGLFAVKKLAGLKDALGTALKTTFSNAATEAATGFSTSGLKGLLSSKLGKIGAISISLTIAVEAIKWAHDQWKNIFDNYTQEEIHDAIQLTFKDAFNSVPGKIATWTATGGFVGEIADKICQAITGEGFKVKIAETLADAFEGLGAIFSGKYSAEEWVNGIGEMFSDMGKAINDGAKSLQEKTEYANYVISMMQKGKGNEILSKDAWKKQKENAQKEKKEREKRGKDNKWLADATPSKSQIEQTKSYSKQMSKLTDTMDKLKVPTQQQSEYLRILKKALENGSLSTEKFTKLTNNQKLSTKQLADAIGKVQSKSVKVNASVSGSEDVKNAKDNLDAMKDKDIQLAVKTGSASDIAEAFRKKLDTIPDTKTTKLSAKLDGKGVKDAKEKLKSINGKAVKIPIQFGISQKQLNILKMFKPGGNNAAFDNAIKKSGLPDIADIAAKFPVYATGGFPEDGFFYANHNELVGRFTNGRTAVANNDQIVQGITQAVAPAVYSAVKAAMNESDAGNGGGGDVYLDGAKLTESVIGHINKISQSRNRSPIWGVN